MELYIYHGKESVKNLRYILLRGTCSHVKNDFIVSIFGSERKMFDETLLNWTESRKRAVYGKCKHFVFVSLNIRVT